MQVKIIDLPSQERPRERLYALGTNSLSVQELLQIIIAQGNAKDSVFNVAQELTVRYGGLDKLTNASLKELQAIKGIGYVKAAQIKAALELGRRVYIDQTNKSNKQSIFNSAEAYKLANAYLKNKNKEHLLLFCMDTRARLLCEPEIVSVGTLDASLVHPREIFDLAIKAHAHRILLAHNHPSGSSQPSTADLQVTKQIYAAGKIMGIELIDHIVVGDNEFCSIREHHEAIFV